MIWTYTVVKGTYSTPEALEEVTAAARVRLRLRRRLDVRAHADFHGSGHGVIKTIKLHYKSHNALIYLTQLRIYRERDNKSTWVPINERSQSHCEHFCFIYVLLLLLLLIYLCIWKILHLALLLSIPIHNNAQCVSCAFNSLLASWTLQDAHTIKCNNNFSQF